MQVRSSLRGRRTVAGNPVVIGEPRASQAERVRPRYGVGVRHAGEDDVLTAVKAAVGIHDLAIPSSMSPPARYSGGASAEPGGAVTLLLMRSPMDHVLPVQVVSVVSWRRKLPLTWADAVTCWSLRVVSKWSLRERKWSQERHVDKGGQSLGHLGAPPGPRRPETASGLRTPY